MGGSRGQFWKHARGEDPTLAFASWPEIVFELRPTVWRVVMAGRGFTFCGDDVE
jgi:hypothetical protein